MSPLRREHGFTHIKERSDNLYIHRGDKVSEKRVGGMQSHPIGGAGETQHVKNLNVDKREVKTPVLSPVGGKYRDEGSHWRVFDAKRIVG